MKKSLNLEHKTAQSTVRTLSTLLLPVGMLCVVLIVWEVGTRVSSVPAWILPSPSRIWSEAMRSINLLAEHSLITLMEAVAGFLTATTVGFVVALACEWSAGVKKTLYPLLVVSQTVPTIALAPLLALWFGFGYTSKIAVITLVCFFPIALGLLHGFDSVPEAPVRAFKAMGARKAQVLRMVKLPFALPSFFSGMRIAATYSVLGAVIAEWFGGQKGLGILLVRSAKSYLTDRVFATVCVIAVLTLLIVGVIELISRRSVAWFYQQKKIIS